MTGDVISVLRLYQRCKRWNVLPHPGGLMDQDEGLMQLMDVIEQRAEAARVEAATDARMKAAHDENLRKLGVRNA